MLACIMKLKKLLLILLIVIVSGTFNAHSKIYKLGEKLTTNQIKIDKKITIDLTEGDWFVARRDEAHYGWLTQFLFGFIRVDNGKVVEAIEVYDGDLGESFQAYVNDAVYRITFKDPYDGCYERPEYYLVEVFKAGIVHNCMVVGHRDLIKELNNPDDPNGKQNSIDYRIFLAEKNFELSNNIALYSTHWYFSRHNRNDWYRVYRFLSPSQLNAPKNKFLTEESSEYHKYNIDNYPKHKAIMEKWISNSAKFHKQFEIMNTAKKHHKLDLVKYIINDDSNIKQGNITKSLKQLNDLFKSGVLSDDEFIKAKKKLLD